MTSDEAAFIRTILDAPDDAAPKVVFADWLEDDGQQERAEFLRLLPEIILKTPSHDGCDCSFCRTAKAIEKRCVQLSNPPRCPKCGSTNMRAEKVDTPGFSAAQTLTLRVTCLSCTAASSKAS
jgi:uncharacterized protein (TIGR02996 family)